jgi:hypothetical protein
MVRLRGIYRLKLKSFGYLAYFCFFDPPYLIPGSRSEEATGKIYMMVVCFWDNSSTSTWSFHSYLKEPLQAANLDSRITLIFCSFSSKIFGYVASWLLQSHANHSACRFVIDRTLKKIEEEGRSEHRRPHEFFHIHIVGEVCKDLVRNGGFRLILKPHKELMKFVLSTQFH